METYYGTKFMVVTCFVAHKIKKYSFVRDLYGESHEVSLAVDGSQRCTLSGMI